MKNAKFESLQHIPGERAHLVQGIKGHHTPKGAISGGNGSFIVKGAPTQLNLTVCTSDGTYVRNNIAYLAKEKYDRSRITEKFVDQLREDLPKKEFTVDDNGFINWN